MIIIMWAKEFALGDVTNEINVKIVKDIVIADVSNEVKQNF